MRAKCKDCKLSWNISIYQDIREGYICPKCTARRKRREKANKALLMVNVIGLILIVGAGNLLTAAIGIVLFAAGFLIKDEANKESPQA